MANANKKDFNKMLFAPMEIKIVTLDDKGKEKWGGRTMVVAKKTDYDELFKEIPPSKVVTTNEVRKALAKKYSCDICCPLTAGIFTNIVAWASFQRKSNVTPFWRVLKTNGELNEKFPSYPELQKKLLEEEGFTIYQKGKKYFVKDYQNFLFDFSKK